MKPEHLKAIEGIDADRKRWMKTELMVDLQITGEMAETLIDEFFGKRENPPAFWIARSRLEKVLSGEIGWPHVYTTDQSEHFECVPLFISAPTPAPAPHLVARIAELEAALRPFAREAEEYNGWIGAVMVEADEEGGMREAWYKISDIRHARDILSSAHHTHLTEGERNAIIEGCALLIEKHAIQDTADGKRLVPRQEGNRDGLRYADGIRAMKWETTPPPQTNVTGPQDISTAPKMTDVLVWWPILQLDEDGEPTEQVVDGRWIISEDQGGYWIEPDVMNAIGDHLGDDFTYAAQPSHWMPLPAPLFVAKEDQP